MKTRLTLRTVEGAKPFKAPYEIRDADIVGLLLRVQPSGVKTFYVELTRGVRVRLGRYPVLTVEGARVQAKAKIGEFAATGERPKPKVKVTTFGDFIRDHYAPWFAAERRTGDRNIAVLEAEFGDLYRKPLADVNAWTVEKYKAARLRAGIKPATVNRDVGRLRGALSKAVEWGLLQEHPLRSVKRAKGEDNSRVRYLTPAEEKALRKALDAREAQFRERRESGNGWREDRGIAPLPAIKGYADHLMPMVLLSLNTGMRRGELIALEWADVNLPGKMLTVRAENAKSGKARHLPLNAEALAVLKRWRTQRKDDGRVFGLLDAKTAWRALLADAGITGFRWHDLRHDFASKLVMRGVPLNTVRELLGHASLATTLRYAHLAPSHLADAVAMLGSGR